jgi:electron transfer flavoprotein beta subunit
MELFGGVPVKIIALVKYSMDVAEVRVDHVTRALRMSGVPYRFGDLDRGVVEASVQLTEANGGELEVLTFGPPGALGAMKELLAMGADEATLVDDPYSGAADAAIVARILEAAVRRRGPFDLVMCGFASDDGYSQQTGPRLAARLGMPFVSYVTELSIDGDSLVVSRDLDDVVEKVVAPLPAVVSVAEEAFVPRNVTLLQMMKAQKKPVNRWDLGHLDLVRAELEQGFGYETLGETGLVIERHQLLLKDDDLAEMADRLIDYLVEQRVFALPGGA